MSVGVRDLPRDLAISRCRWVSAISAISAISRCRWVSAISAISAISPVSVGVRDLRDLPGVGGCP